MKLRTFFTLRKGVFISVVLLVMFTIYTIVSPIREVECISLDRPCHEPVASRLTSVGKGKPAFLAMKAINGYLVKENRVITSRLIYSFPRKIRVDIITREPSIALRPAGVDEYTLFDEEGRVIDVVNETNLPTLTVSEAISATQISFVAQLYASLVTYFGVTSGQITEGALKVTIGAMNQPYNFNYPVEGDVDRLLGATRVVLGELNVEHENPTMKTIDFRFKNPVVKKL